MRGFLDCSTTIGNTIKAFHKRSHWHCYLCTQLFRRITEFRTHLAHHEKKLNPPVKRARKNPAVDVNDIADHSIRFTEDDAAEHDHACSECGKRLLKTFPSTSCERGAQEEEGGSNNRRTISKRNLRGLQQRNFHG